MQGGNALYRRITEQLPLAAPGFSHATLDDALRDLGATPDRVTDLQMERALRNLLRSLVLDVSAHGGGTIPSRAGIVVTDAADCIVTVSPAALLLVGLPETAALIGKSRRDIPALARCIPSPADFADADEVRITESDVDADLRHIQCVSHLDRDPDGTVRGVRTTVQDITVQTRVYAEVDTLYQASEERVRELTALVQMARIITSAGSLDATLDAITRKTVDLLKVQAAAIFLPDVAGMLALAGHCGLPDGYIAVVDRLIAETDDRGDGDTPVQSPTMLAFHDGAAHYRATPAHPAYVADTTLHGWHIGQDDRWESMLAVPLIAQGETIGVLTCYLAEPVEPPPDTMRLLMAVADGAAITVRNSRLTAATQRQLTEATALHESAARVNASLDRAEVLQTIVEQAAHLAGANAAALAELDESGEILVGRAMYGFPQSGLHRAPIFREGPIIQALKAGEPMIVRNRAEMPAMVWLRPDMLVRWNKAGIEALIALPFGYQNEKTATMILLFDHPIAPTASEMQLLATFADHAAVAMHNTQLYEQAQQVAALEERNRLARDLHDSVTQSLFSISLLAQVIPALIDTQRDDALRSLDELRRLSKEALAEMRALLFQLRPVALEDDGLVEALTKHLAALQRRDGPLITFVCEGCEERLPLPVEETLFRVATEAVNNALKHAHARTVAVHLHEPHDEPSLVTLTIQDDGTGFDPAGQRVQAGHLGLSGMRERVARSGGVLTLTSALGGGTTVTVRIAVPRPPIEGDDA